MFDASKTLAEIMSKWKFIHEGLLILAMQVMTYIWYEKINPRYINNIYNMVNDLSKQNVLQSPHIRSKTKKLKIELTIKSVPGQKHKTITMQSMCKTQL